MLAEQCAGFGMCLAPWEADAHADHEAAGRAARRAARLAGVPVLTYPIWMWHWAKPGRPAGPLVPGTPGAAAARGGQRKQAAIGAFTSQLTDRDPATGPVLAAGFVAHFTRSRRCCCDDRRSRLQWAISTPCTRPRPTRGGSPIAGTSGASTRSAWRSFPPSGTTAPSSRAVRSGCSASCWPRAVTPCCPATWPRPPSGRRGADQDLPQVRVEQREIPGQWPSGRFDLIVLSEVLYYFGDHDLEQVLKHAAASLEPGGTLLAVHWRHPVADYPRTGDDVHRALARQPGLARLVSHTEPDFLAEVYIRTEGARSRSPRRRAWCDRIAGCRGRRGRAGA